MKCICVNCAYRNQAIDKWPCDSCRDVGGVMSMFVPDGSTDDESNSCNDDYCEISFEEE